MIRNTILCGDAREQLRLLDDESVNCVVTSPPYWGLRDYGVKGQLGAESTPEEFVCNLVDVFREVRRVLRSDGTVWLNLGDSYAGSGRGMNKDGTPNGGEKQQTNAGSNLDFHDHMVEGGAIGRFWVAPPPGLKQKDMVGIPWRVAFALQADGWWLRSDIIWSKPNPMPESVQDRPTKAHEYLFLLSKSANYFYDAAAIREGIAESRIVKAANGDDESLIFGQYLGREAAHSAFGDGVRVASAVLNLAQRQEQVGLLPLDSEIGTQRSNGDAGLLVVGVPVIRRAASEAARFTDGDVSAKEFLRELNSLCVALPDGHDLKETWRLALGNVGHIDADSDRSVAVNDASKVGQIEFIHDQHYTKASVPSSHMTGTQRNDGARWRNADGGVAPRVDKQRGHGRRHAGFNDRWDHMTKEEQASGGHNKRTVWEVATVPYPEAHFATFPTKLVKPCILAGCPEGGIVLDPFLGSGTTALVAKTAGRDYIGIELNPKYVELAERRINVDQERLR